VCSRKVVIDGASGGCAVTLAWTGETPAVLDPKTLTSLGPVRIETWTATSQNNELSAEENLRGIDDQKISDAILMEFLREEQALNAATIIGGQAWRLLATLHN
jgi:hypothetical protein